MPISSNGPPMGIRNNNPGNLLHVEGEPWQGEVFPVGRYARFSTAVLGIRALMKQLMVDQYKHGCRTVADFIGRWAPPNENDTKAYIADVEARLGVTPGEIILIDSDLILLRLTKAIIQHENGYMPYSDGELMEALTRAKAP